MATANAADAAVSAPRAEMQGATVKTAGVAHTDQTPAAAPATAAVAPITATICTALYKRGLRNQFIQDVHPLNPNGAPMVGEAFTLRYIPARG